MGAYLDDDNGSGSGSAYYFQGLNANISGAATETLKLTAFDGTGNDLFGYSVSISGDLALVGAFRDGNSGSAYRARISNMTTLDGGGLIRTHSAIDFESRIDWIIGSTTDGNQLTLLAGTTAVVDGVGHSIQIGAGAGADFNRLIVGGTVEGTDLFIGSQDGNLGNELVMLTSGTLNVDNVYLAAGNFLVLEGDYTDYNSLLSYLSSTTRPTSLFADNGINGWELIDSSNASSWLVASYDAGGSGLTRIGLFSAVPEPGSAALLSLALFGISFRRRREMQLS
ncbi:MAG: PEP-CTERM sorting domain-containing protein [Pirellulaceae bacterium]